MTSPSPPQREQATLVTTWPSSDWRTRRSSPAPAHSTQVMGSVPGAVPRPEHSDADGREADGELLARPEDRLGELEVEAHLGVGTRRRASAPAAGAPHLPEERLEDVADAALEAETAPSGLGAEHPLGTEAVVPGAPLGVAQHLVGHRHLFELGLGDCVPGIGVGVQLTGPRPVGPLDLVLGGVPAHAQQRVEVAQPVNAGHRDPLARPRHVRSPPGAHPGAHPPRARRPGPAGSPSGSARAGPPPRDPARPTDTGDTTTAHEASGS